MKLPHRRHFLRLAAGTAALPALPRIASALDYPTRPVHLVVGYPPGGVVDLYGRLFGQWLSERLGQPFVIENRPGANSNLATDAVVRSPPDGYTLLQASSANAWNTALYDNLTFNFVRDIAPVGSIYRAPGILVVQPSFPARSVPELITFAKANPGKLTMASAGTGSTQHVYGELFKTMTGVDFLHVPFRGNAPALSALLGGQVSLMFDTISTSMEYVRAGTLRALAVTSLSRVDILPDVPTVSEFVPGYEGIGWQGICAPKNTPSTIIEALNNAINAGLADQQLKTRITDFGATVFPSSPGEFGQFIVEFTEKWARVIKAANIKAE